MNQLKRWAARVHHRWVLRRQRRTYRRLFSEPDVRVLSEKDIQGIRRIAADMSACDCYWYQPTGPDAGPVGDLLCACGHDLYDHEADEQAGTGPGGRCLALALLEESPP